MHFEMNPRDPEYDAKIYLAVDQVNQCSTAASLRNEMCVWLRIAGGPPGAYRGSAIRYYLFFVFWASV